MINTSSKAGSMKRLILTLLLSLTTSAASFAADAPASDEAIVSIIEKSSLLPGYKVSARLTGTEALISTYRNAESKKDAQDNDCKIDAILIAKELMISNSLGVRRVKVHFHEPVGHTGIVREVIVTLPEVKAFAAKDVTQEELLSSLTLNKFNEAGNEKPVEKAQTTPENKTPEQGSADAGSAPSTDTAIAAATPAATPATAAEKKPQPKVAPPKTVYKSKVGIEFDVPNGWVVDDKIHSGDTVLKINSLATKQDNIILKLMRTNKTPAELATGMKKEFSYEGVSFEKYQSTYFGKQQYPGAIIFIVYPHESHQPYYDMHLYFGKPPLVYDLYAWCANADARTVKPAYNEVMTTINFPSAKPAPKAPTKPAGKR